MTSSLVKIEVGLLLALSVLGMGVAVQASEVTGQLSSGGATTQTPPPSSGGGTTSKGSISGSVSGEDGGGAGGRSTSRNSGTTDTSTGSVLGASTGVESVTDERFVRSDTYLTDGTNLTFTETVEAAEVDSQELALADTSLMSTGLWFWLLLLLLLTAGAGYYYYVYRHRKETPFLDQA